MSKKIQKLIGEKIKASRIKANMRQRELAKETNYSESCISAFENGERTPKLFAAFNIADSLGCSVEDFRPEEEPKAFDY